MFSRSPTFSREAYRADWGRTQPATVSAALRRSRSALQRAAPTCRLHRHPFPRPVRGQHPSLPGVLSELSALEGCR